MTTFRSYHTERTDLIQSVSLHSRASRPSPLPHRGVLVVEGGPGTGKTAVALHRAAYLLYEHRELLAKRAVLIVGPNPAFLGDIGEVLPSLGETGVLLATSASCSPGVKATAADTPEAAAVRAAPTWPTCSPRWSATGRRCPTR
ncbi:hypothetical protein SCYAM73S_06165 [Streptomyces cyaneofuscatus]